MIERYDNEITVTYKGYYIWLSMAMIFLSFFGVLLLISLFPLDKGNLANGIFGVVAVICWTLFDLVMGIYAMVMYSKKVIINGEGVTERTFLSEKHLHWNEIGDFGLSFAIYSQYDGNTYDLYFSRDVQKSRDRYKKKLKGEMIKITINQKMRSEAVDTLIPYCQTRTAVTPFIGEGKL